MEQSQLTVPQAIVRVAEIWAAESQRTSCSFFEGMLWMCVAIIVISACMVACLVIVHKLN